jgi:hypothetical protein
MDPDMKDIKPEIAQARIERARSAVEKGIVYRLGKGGFNSANDSPGWDHGQCDCSGFVSWVLQTRRSPKKGRNFWIETTAIAHDVREGETMFVECDPQPGCLCVYGDSGGHQGHIGVVTSATLNGDRDVIALRGIDCSMGSYRQTGDAVQERDLTKVFGLNARTIYCCLKQDVGT